MSGTGTIVACILAYYPTTHAIYLFGTYGTDDERPDSDIDVAVLLPPGESRRLGQLMLAPCHLALAGALGRPVDLLNAREVSTVMQNEVVSTGRRLYSADEYATAEFGMLTLSYYQKLNEERAAILEAFRETGKAYDV